MNIDSAVALTLALLVTGEVLTEEQADEMFQHANAVFTGQSVPATIASCLEMLDREEA